MKHLIFGILIGGAIGAGITYYICKKNFDKKIEEERAKIRAEYKEYYERKQEEEDTAKASHKPAVPDKPVETAKECAEKKQYKNLAGLYDRAELEHPSEDDLVEMTENEEKLHDALSKAHDKVKIIQVESFGEIQSYECESLTYYVYDKTLCHENGDIVDDVEYLVEDALDRYGWADNDEDTDALYVRNYKIQKDFEIVKVLDEYPDK